MCRFCDDGSIILEHETLNPNVVGFCGDVNSSNVYDLTYNNGLFIDRGYLRMVDLDDCGCLDHGRKVKILFCPFCGKNLNNLQNDEV